MPKIFVHGNPETSALWRALFAELKHLGVDDLIALSPPGFGSPVPAGFEPTQIGYRDWLIRELEAFGGNIDLVGHDWGAGHVYGVLAERPDLLRSWAADCAGLIHREYVWHEGALAWQTLELGEQAIGALFGMSDADRAAIWTSLGMRADIAEEIAAEQNDEMGRCVLALYRSAKQPAMAELGQRLRGTSKRPGLVLIASEDPYAGTAEVCVSVARDLDARCVTLAGLGHWWMFDGCKPAAEALVTHWESA